MWREVSRPNQLITITITNGSIQQRTFWERLSVKEHSDTFSSFRIWPLSCKSTSHLQSPAGLDLQSVWLSKSLIRDALFLSGDKNSQREILDGPTLLSKNLTHKMYFSIWNIISRKCLLAQIYASGSILSPPRTPSHPVRSECFSLITILTCHSFLSNK